jgi:hypothetical protein
VGGVLWYCKLLPRHFIILDGVSGTLAGHTHGCTVVRFLFVSIYQLLYRKMPYMQFFLFPSLSLPLLKIKFGGSDSVIHTDDCRISASLLLVCHLVHSLAIERSGNCTYSKAVGRSCLLALLLSYWEMGEYDCK